MPRHLLGFQDDIFYFEDIANIHTRMPNADFRRPAYHYCAYFYAAALPQLPRWFDFDVGDEEFRAAEHWCSHGPSKALYRWWSSYARRQRQCFVYIWSPRWRRYFRFIWLLMRETQFKNTIIIFNTASKMILRGDGGTVVPPPQSATQPQPECSLKHKMIDISPLKRISAATFRFSIICYFYVISPLVISHGRLTTVSKALPLEGFSKFPHIYGLWLTEQE